MKISRSIDYSGLTALQATGLACEAMKQLNWTTGFANQETLKVEPVLVTGESGPLYIHFHPDQLIITTDDPAEYAEPAVMNGQAAIEVFINKFEILRMSATAYDLSEWADKANLYRNVHQIDPGAEEAEESLTIPANGQRPYITYTLIAVNLLIFLAMLVSGVSLFSPTGADIINWGGNYGPFTKAGDWWRLITCMFVHVGIVHLLFNMYALLMVGVHLESLLGKARFLIAYFSTGVFAGLVSTWWHEEPVASAGASGAIFGMYGLFLALLTTSLIPKKTRRQLLPAIGIFVGYNLVGGLISDVDNAAHIGGLLSGIIAGYIFYLSMRKEVEGRSSPYPAMMIALATALIAFIFLQRNAPVEVRDDSEKFSRTMEHFGALEELALEAMNPADTVSETMYLKELKKTALTDWVECVNLFEAAEQFALSPRLKALRVDMLEYSNHRVQQTLLVIKAAEERTEQYKPRIDSIEEKIRGIIEKVQEGTSPTQEL